MGSEDLFRKRKAGSTKPARKHATRHRLPKILIVCEDSKSVPNYLSALKDEYKLTTVTVRGDGDSCPCKVVQHGIFCYRQERQRGKEPYDKVYLVFDHDDRDEKYGKAIHQISCLEPNNVFIAIPTRPCFEFWLLLHYGYFDAPYFANGTKTVGYLAEKKLKEFFPKYSKGGADVFKHTEKYIETAIQNADRLCTHSHSHDSDNPSTKMHVLISALQKLRDG